MGAFCSRRSVQISVGSVQIASEPEQVSRRTQAPVSRTTQAPVSRRTQAPVSQQARSFQHEPDGEPEPRFVASTRRQSAEPPWFREIPVNARFTRAQRLQQLNRRGAWRRIASKVCKLLRRRQEWSTEGRRLQATAQVFKHLRRVNGQLIHNR
jgi:hypothetical protein